jgi:hypothetical protein
MGLGRPVLGAGRKYSQHSADKRGCKHFGGHWPQLNDASRRATREERYSTIESRSCCVERMLRRASSPPALLPSIYRREMHVPASLA